MADNFDVDINLRLREAGAAAASAAVTRALKDVETQAGAAGKAIDQQISAAVKRIDATPAAQLAAAIQRIETQRARKEVDALARSLMGIEDAGKKATAGLDQALKQNAAGFSALKNIAGAFGVTLSAQFAVGAVVDFGKEVIALGSKITDLSSRMGVGVEAAQEINYALTQTGSSAEAGSRAILKMNDGLTEGKKGTVAALKDLNLEIHTLRGLKPEDAFMAIATAIHDVPDPMRQTQLAMELFGKAGAEILPAIKQGMAELRDEAHKTGQVLSKEDVKALDDFGDMWDAQMNRMKVGAAQAALAIKDAFHQSLAAITVDFIREVKDWNTIGLSGALGRALSNQATLTRNARQTDIVLGVEPPVDDRQTADEKAAEKAAAAAAARAEKAEQARIHHLATFYQQQEKEAKAYYDKVEAFEFKMDLAVAKANVDALKDAKTTADGKAKAVLESLEREQKAREDADRVMRRITQSATQFELGEIQRRLDKKIAAIKLENVSLERQQAEIAAVTTEASTAMLAEVAKTKEFKVALYEVLAAVGQFQPELLEVEKGATKVHKALDWSSSLDDLSRSFSQLAQIGGDTFGGIAQQIAEMIGLMGVGAQAGKQLHDVFARRDASGKIITGTGAGFSLQAFQTSSGGYSVGSVAGGAAQAAPAVVAGYGALMQATDVAGRGNRAARGALTGASIGGQMAGPYGALVGAGVGALVGALRNPAWEDVQKRLGHEMGVKITEEFARTIADQAKALFKGDRATAEMFNFAGILDAAGGANASNIDKFSSKFRDVFTFMSRGQLSVEQAAKVIDQSWDTMAQAAMKNGGLITGQLRDMIALNKDWTVNAESIKAFSTAQTESAVGHLGNFLGIGNAARTAANDTTGRDKLAALDAEKAALLGKEGGPGTEDQARLKAIEAERVPLAKGEADRGQASKVASLVTVNSQGAAGAVAGALSGSLAMLQQQGMSLPDALKQIEPAVLALREQLTATGFQGGAAFEDLEKKIALAKDVIAGPTLAAMQELGSSIGDLYNGGVLTDDMFKGMTAQVAAMRQGLIDQGVDGAAVFDMMKPQLQEIYEINQRMPGVIDDATKEMLAQAEAQGVVGDKFKSANERMVDGINKVAHILETVFADKLPKAAETAATAITGALSKIPKDFPVRVKVDYDDPGPPSGSSGKGDGEQSSTDYPGAADGVYGDGRGGGLTWFGEGGEPELGGPRRFMAGVMADAMAMSGGGFGGTIQPAPVYLDGRKVGEIMFERLPRTMQDRGIRRQ